MKSTRTIRTWCNGTCLVVLLGVTLVPPAALRAWAETATDQLKGSVGQVIRVLEDPRLKPESMTAQRRAAIRKEADNIFDFAESAKRALGPHWQGLSEKDRGEFVSVYADLLERAYISKIDRYTGERISYERESVDGDLATVKSRFITKQGTEIPIDYRLLRRGDRWLVYDVSVEGVSLIGNYRTQFNKIIQTASYQELVRKMKAAEFTAPGAAPQRDKAPRS